MMNTVKNTLDNIYAMLAVGAGLIVLGAILALSGVNIPIGITLMALGAFMLYSVISEHWDELPEKMKGIIKAFLVVAGLVGVFLGLILAFTGHIFIGLAMVVLGALAIWGGLSLELKSEEAQKEFESTLSKLFVVISYVMLVIGIILLLTSHFALGLGAIIGAITLLHIAKKDPDGQALANEINKQLEPVFVIGGTLFLVLGILLCLGGDLLHGIGLIAVGAFMLGYAVMNAQPGGLVKALTAPFDMAVEWIKRLFENLYIWMIKNVPFFDKIAEVFSGKNKVRQYKKGDYNLLDFNNIAADLKIESVMGIDTTPILKGMYEQRTGKKLYSYGIQDGKEVVIEQKDIDEANLEYLKKMGLKVPKYATGAVIPGGSPFLAMLGDQRRGQTNVEAPLDTIVEAFKAVQPEQKFTIEATGSMSQLIKLLNLEIKKEDRRSSIKAVKV